MATRRFDWDPDKDAENQRKHGVPFIRAQYAFGDPQRVIAKDITHSQTEERFYCFGEVDGGVLTVRFTYRASVIRIIGAGYWRKGKAIYERGRIGFPRRRREGHVGPQQEESRVLQVGGCETSDSVPTHDPSAS
jgi:uncharacterized DUF497 family protein